MELISKGSELEFFDSEVELSLLKRRLILNVTLGYGVTLELRERIKIATMRHLQFKEIS